jgi:hypothetical protein
MTDYITDSSQVVSVWSAYGHRFISDGEENYESCLTCGAMYQLLALADDPTRGEYLNMHGDAPHDCTRDTSMVHGYSGEREDGPNHDCDCLICDS